MSVILEKIWATLKAYWYIPALLLVAGILVFVGHPAASNLFNIMKKASDDHKKELEQIDAEHQKELQTRDEALANMQKTLDSIEQQYKDAQVQLDDKKKKEIKKILSETHDNPEELAKRLSDTTGFRVILPSND